MDLAARRFRLLVIYGVLGLPFLAYGAVQALQSNANSPLDWVNDAFPAKRDYARFREAFGGGEFLVVSWSGCTTDSPSLATLTRILRESPDFYDGGRWYFEAVTTGRDLLLQMTSSPLSLPRDEAIRRLRGTMVGADGAMTVAVIAFTDAALRCRERLVPLIRGALTKHCQVPADDIHMAGSVMDGLAVDQAGRAALDQFALPSAVITLLVCWYCLRSFRAAAFVMVLAIVAQGATLALMHYCGDRMSALLTVLPPLVQVLAVAGGIHLVHYYYDELREQPGMLPAPPQGHVHPRGHAPLLDPALRALRVGWLPCVLSAGTSVVGDASLMLSSLTPIRCFGMYSCAGVLIAFALILTFIPGIFVLWPLRHAPGHAPADTPSAVRHARDFWSPLTTILSHAHWLIVGAALALMLALGVGIAQLRTSVRIDTLFAKNSRVLSDYAWLEEHVGPLVPLEVILRYDAACELPFIERLRLVHRVEKEARQIPGVGGSLSPVTFLPQFPARPDLPPTVYQQAIHQSLEASRRGLANQHYLHVAGGAEELRITVNVSALGATDYGSLLEALRARVEPLLRGTDGARLNGIEATYTGIMPLVQEIQGQLLRDLFESFVSAFLTIGVTMTIVLGSIEAGLLAMVSNVFPALLMFGTLGWLGQVVDIGSVMTASVALGLTIDDTLHYLTFFTEGIGQGMSRQEAVLLAYRRSGAAKLQTSIICAAGLMVFALSDFLPASRFAWIMFALIVLAMLGDVLLLPSLLLSPLGRWCFGTASGTAANETGPPPSPDRGQIPAPRMAAPHLVAATDPAQTTLSPRTYSRSG